MSGVGQLPDGLDARKLLDLGVASDKWQAQRQGSGGDYAIREIGDKASRNAGQGKGNFETQRDGIESGAGTENCVAQPIQGSWANTVLLGQASCFDDANGGNVNRLARGCGGVHHLLGARRETKSSGKIPEYGVSVGNDSGHLGVLGRVSGAAMDWRIAALAFT